MAVTFDPLREAEELREQLASDKRRLLIFFGAGTSQAAGIEGVLQLTKSVRGDLAGSQGTLFDRILKEGGERAHVEHVLNKVRLCRELIGSDATATAGGFTGKEAAELDRAIS